VAGAGSRAPPRTCWIIRSLSRGLEPANPKRGGLRAALRQLATDVSQTHGIPVDFDVSALPLEGVPETATDNLFRMCQGALTQARRDESTNRIELVARQTDGAPGGGAEVRIRYPLAQRLAGDA
jgi:signal transduction histidine kinase